MSPLLAIGVGVAVLAVLDLVLASRVVALLAPRATRAVDGGVRGPLAWSLRLLVRIYRLALSPRVGSVCRFEPSCSAYALDAVHDHGGVRGGALTVRRILRCNPLSKGGYDPVPTRRPVTRHNQMKNDDRVTPVAPAGSRS
jgi:putative membrane protein insertion efficiency factor